MTVVDINMGSDKVEVGTFGDIWKMLINMRKVTKNGEKGFEF